MDNRAFKEEDERSAGFARGRAQRYERGDHCYADGYEHRERPWRLRAPQEGPDTSRYGHNQQAPAHGLAHRYGSAFPYHNVGLDGLRSARFEPVHQHEQDTHRTISTAVLFGDPRSREAVREQILDDRERSLAGGHGHRAAFVEKTEHEDDDYAPRAHWTGLLAVRDEISSREESALPHSTLPQLRSLDAREDGKDTLRATLLQAGYPAERVGMPPAMMQRLPSLAERRSLSSSHSDGSPSSSHGTPTKAMSMAALPRTVSEPPRNRPGAHNSHSHALPTKYHASPSSRLAHRYPTTRSPVWAVSLEGVPPSLLMRSLATSAGSASSDVAAHVDSNGAPQRNKKKRKVRVCTTPGCDKLVVDHGVCIRHGGGKRCNVEGCDCRAQNKGLCWKHGGYTICQVDGCAKRAKSRGMCWSHGGGTQCKTEGCEKIAVSRGRCWAHGGGKRCKISECQKPAALRMNDFCTEHYQAIARGKIAELRAHSDLNERLAGFH